MQNTNDFTGISKDVRKSWESDFYTVANDSYIVVCNQNAIRRALIANCQQVNQQRQSLGRPPEYDESEIKRYESETVNVESQQNEITAALAEIGKYTQAEIPQLTALAREYIAIKKLNAYRKCFLTRGIDYGVYQYQGKRP